MIYEAESGQPIHVTAREAVKAGCDQFLHSGVIYAIDLSWQPVRRVHNVESGSKE